MINRTKENTYAFFPFCSTYTRLQFGGKRFCKCPEVRELLGRDPLWSKRPIRKLELFEWLTESSTVSLALQWTNDNKIERAK